LTNDGCDIIYSGSKVPGSRFRGLKLTVLEKIFNLVIPAKAGVQNLLKRLDSGSSPE
jgi:hypothetical protein